MSFRYFFVVFMLLLQVFHLQTIPSGEYSPLSRPLFIYVNEKSYQRPEVKTFVDFYMDKGPDLTNEVGYVASQDAVYADNRDRLKK